MLVIKDKLSLPTTIPVVFSVVLLFYRHGLEYQETVSYKQRCFIKMSMDVEEAIRVKRSLI